VPRVRKTQSGIPAQPVEAVRGQEYGQGVVQESLQRAMPTPSDTQSFEMPVNAQPPQGGEPAQSAPPPDFNQLRQTLSGVGGLLNRPDDRPNVSFADGIDDPMAQMRSGTLSAANRTGEMMRELSRRTGDGSFADLAARAGF